RKVDASEAVAIGLADRLVSSGQARAAAISMAHEISAFPQIAMRSDRLSAIRQWDLAEAEAIAQEMLLSAEARSAEAMPGAARFAAGAGRHGSSVNSEAD
ncbi:MAG: enoyl-CoA hydratase, partial [Hyphomicrobium sp.]